MEPYPDYIHKYSQYRQRRNSNRSFDYKDPWNDYGKSYDEYGGYNGWSDDVIDDVFDGDPEATWNVD
jgi:hypothetical protein